MIDSLIEPFKVIIVALAFVVFASALLLSIQLRRKTRPLEKQLQALHRSEIPADLLNPLLREIEARYISLLSHVDTVDTPEFSAGEMETLCILNRPWRLSAAAAQSWIIQAPGILISLGLLGTFAGLSVGLGRISTVLQTPDINTALNGLVEIVKPMGAAFETSLIGLLLSILVLVWTQLNGTRSSLERCEALLSSWLETILPQRLGEKVTTPLRKTLGALSSTLASLPNSLSQSIEEGMRRAFEAKLEEMFNINSQLSSEAQLAVRQLSATASSLNESGQDFVEAALAFRDSSFATTLRDSVLDMVAVRETLTTTTDSLSVKLSDLRDGLVGTQAEWKLLATAAQQELEGCRLASQQLGQGATALRQATAQLKEGTEASGEATKQLKATRLEVMRDRKLAVELAEAVKSRLASDSTVAESCSVFASSLELALSNWRRNVERLDELASSYITSVRESKNQDDVFQDQRNQELGKAIAHFQHQLETDLGAAIDSQRTSLFELIQPTESAQALHQQLLRYLEEIQTVASQLSKPPGELSVPSERGAT